MRHTFKDKRGTNSYRNSIRAGSLYPRPNYSQQTIRPRYYSLDDTVKSFTASDRKSMIGYSRELFASSATLHGAIRQKASYSILDAFQPRYRGSNTAWGDDVEAWLKNVFYPVANIRGGNYSFLNTLFALSVALDVDGEALIYLTQSRNGFPQFGVVPSHRIGQRSFNEERVSSGRYKGNRIVDGIITNTDGRAIAYRILGDDETEDYDLASQSCILLFETDWLDALRGVSRLGPVLMDALNSADIDHYLQLQVKLDSSMGLLSWTETGEADAGSVYNPITSESEDALPSTTAAPAPAAMAIEPIMGGMINYFKAGTGEKLEAFKTDRPNANVDAFLQRLERRCMYALGWNYEALNCSALGGASTRLVQNELRNSIKARQNTLTRAARFIVSYAVAVGMKNEFIAPNYEDDWFNWAFNYGELLTVDSGYEAEADRKGLLLGTTTLDAVAAKSGGDWYELRNQTQKEVEDLLGRAQGIAGRYNISIDKALALLSQRSSNEPLALPPGQGAVDPASN